MAMTLKSMIDSYMVTKQYTQTNYHKVIIILKGAMLIKAMIYYLISKKI